MALVILSALLLFGAFTTAYPAMQPGYHDDSWIWTMVRFVSGAVVLGWLGGARLVRSREAGEEQLRQSLEGPLS